MNCFIGNRSGGCFRSFLSLVVMCILFTAPASGQTKATKPKTAKKAKQQAGPLDPWERPEGSIVGRPAPEAEIGLGTTSGTTSRVGICGRPRT